VLRTGLLQLGEYELQGHYNALFLCTDKTKPPSAYQGADRSVHSERGIECPEQSRVAEWLEQAFDRTLFE
jgi:hypothetical protein